MGDFIRVERLVKLYRARDGTEVEALRDVSFAVERGEFVTLVGHSGCGKSTLLKILAGLAERSDGTVTIDGRAVDGPRPDVGIVFQKPLLLEWRRVWENVLLPIEIYGLDRKRYEEKAHRLDEPSRQHFDLHRISASGRGTAGGFSTGRGGKSYRADSPR